MCTLKCQNWRKAVPLYKYCVSKILFIAEYVLVRLMNSFSMCDWVQLCTEIDQQSFSSEIDINNCFLWITFANTIINIIEYYLTENNQLIEKSVKTLSLEIFIITVLLLHLFQSWKKLIWTFYEDLEAIASKNGFRSWYVIYRSASIIPIEISFTNSFSF